MKQKLFFLLLMFSVSIFAQNKLALTTQLSESGNSQNKSYISEVAETEDLKNTTNEWVHWDDGQNHDAIGTGSAGYFTAAAKWNSSQLAPYDGQKLTKVKIFIQNNDFSSLVLRIWTGNNASNLVYQIQLTEVSANSWKQIDIPTEIIINDNEELWVGYKIHFNDGAYCAGVDQGPANTGFGDMISMDGNNWEQLSADYDLDFNWNIQFYAEETATNVSANFGGNPTHIEEGQSVHFLDASIGATAWEWEFEGGSPATSTQQSPWVTYETPGTYDVKLIAKNGNDSDTEFRADYITVNAASGGEEIEVEVIADPGTSICESGNVLLTASATGGTGNYNYTWTWNLDASVVHGSQLSVSNLIQNAEVYLKVTSGTQEYNTSISLSVIDSPPASIVGKGSPETLLICPHADLEYQWYQNNSPISGATEQFYYPGENQTLSGTYYVETKNANACSSYSENHTIGTKSLSLSYEKYMRIFPNPSSGDFTIELSSLSDLEDIEELELSIYNLAGQEIWKAQLEHHFLSQVNPPLKWQKGLYLIKLKARGTIFETQKVIIY